MENLKEFVDRVKVTMSIIFAKKPIREEYKKPEQPMINHSIIPDEKTRPELNDWYRQLGTHERR